MAFVGLMVRLNTVADGFEKKCGEIRKEVGLGNLERVEMEMGDSSRDIGTRSINVQRDLFKRQV